MLLHMRGGFWIERRIGNGLEFDDTSLVALAERVFIRSLASRQCQRGDVFMLT
jgi:hypothetical protein